MSGYKNFAIVGAGIFGSFVVRQFLKDKAAGTVNEVIVLTRQVRIPRDRRDCRIVHLFMDRGPRPPSRVTPKWSRSTIPTKSPSRMP